MKVSRFATILFVAAVVFVSGKPAPAYTVTVYAEGVVTEVQTYDGLEFDGSVIVGSIMTGSFTYDTEAPDQIQYDGAGRYSVISISMGIGSYTFLPDPQATQSPYFFINTGTTSFHYDVVSPEALFYGPCYLNGEPTNLEDLPSGGFRIMYLVANINSPIGDALPNENTFPDLSVFDEDRYFSVESSLIPAFRIYGEVTSLTVVPEPASVLLFGLAGLALLRKRRK